MNMSSWLLSPPIAFLVYLLLVAGLGMVGRKVVGTSQVSAVKSSTYSSGEAPPTRMAAPGYRPYFVVALFFAILHLGALMLGSSDLSPMATVYLVGLMMALLALILG
jgi:NADH:ubiquinone oxidoreductase subunit 3 (subunit A)